MEVDLSSQAEPLSPPITHSHQPTTPSSSVKAAAAVEQQGQMDSMFVYEHSVGAALRAVQQQVGEGYFQSLHTEWDRVLVECSDQR